jgi:predicted DNA-binding transcriptional regulator AlpA
VGEEILTVDALAEFLSMSRRQIYSMTETRTRAKQQHPLPVLRINGNLRFSKSAVEAWLAKLQEGSVQ